MALGLLFSFLKLARIIISKIGDTSSVLQELKLKYAIAPLSSSNMTNIIESLLSMTRNNLFFIKAIIVQDAVILQIFILSFP